MPSQDQTTRVACGPAPGQSLAFRNKLQSRLDHGSHAEGSAVGGLSFRTGDLAVYLDGELYITGRIKQRQAGSSRVPGRVFGRQALGRVAELACQVPRPVLRRERDGLLPTEGCDALVIVGEERPIVGE